MPVDIRVSILIILGLATLTVLPVYSDNQLARDSYSAKLKGFNEVPPILSTGLGRVAVTLVPGDRIEYELRYRTEGEISQINIQVAQKDANGGVSAVLCSSEEFISDDTPTCRPDGVRGVLLAEDVIGPSEQGIDPGQLGKLMDAIRSGLTYVNIYTDKFATGELRGQLQSTN